MGIADVLGRIVHEEVLSPELGLNTKKLDLSDLSPTVYVVFMDDGKRRTAQRIICE